MNVRKQQRNNSCFCRHGRPTWEMSEGHDEILMHSWIAMVGNWHTPKPFEGHCKRLPLHRFYFWTLWAACLKFWQLSAFFTLDYRTERGNFSRYFDVFWCILYFVRLRLVSDSWHLRVYRRGRRGVKPSAEPFATMAVAGRVASRCHSVRGASAEGQPCPSASSKSSTYIIQNISKYNNSEPATMNYTRSFKDIQATSSPSSNTLSSICRHQRGPTSTGLFVGAVSDVMWRHVTSCDV